LIELSDAGQRAAEVGLSIGQKRLQSNRFGKFCDRFFFPALVEEHRPEAIARHSVPRLGPYSSLKLFECFVLLPLRIQNRAQPEVSLNKTGSFLQRSAIMRRRQLVLALLGIIAT